MKHYAILRHGKITATSLGVAKAHNHRTAGVKGDNINKDHTRLNMNLPFDGLPLNQRIKAKLSKLAKKPRKDAVVVMELVLSASPEWFDAIETDRVKLSKHERLKEWLTASLRWAQAEFGDRLVDAVVHLDEKSPHMHFMVVPLTPDGRLCAKEVMSRKEMIKRQTSYADAMKPFGLHRGDPASETKRKHVDLDEKEELEVIRLRRELKKAHEQIAELKAELKPHRDAELLRELDRRTSEEMTRIKNQIRESRMLDSGAEERGRAPAANARTHGARDSDSPAP